jgi:aldehyde oxidoreductase
MPFQQVLADKKIFRYGDCVAIALADTNEHARAAAAAVKVELEPLTEYLNYLDAVAPGAMSIQEGSPNQWVLQPVLKGDYKNIPEIIKNSAYSVSGSFHSTREPHLSLEGDVVQSYFERGRHDSPSSANRSSLPANRFYGGGCPGLRSLHIRIIQNRPAVLSAGPLSANSLRALRRCTLVTGLSGLSHSFSWEEFPAFHRQARALVLKRHDGLRRKRPGSPRGSTTSAGHRAYGGIGEGLMQRMAIYSGWPYKIPNVVGLNREAFTNHNYEITYRGYGGPQLSPARRDMIDMLAEKAGGIDPFEFRYINAARPGDLNMEQRPYRELATEELFAKARPAL